MIIHKITVNEYEITPKYLEIGTKGSCDIECLDISLSNDWRGMACNASFYPYGAKEGVSVVFAAGEVIKIPCEVTAISGEAQMMIEGISSSRIIRSLPLKLGVKYTLSTAITPAPEPTQATYTQIMAATAEAVTAAHEVQERADSGEFDGKDGIDGNDGINGKSAYEIAVEQGFTGTEAEWIESLKGEPGKDGKDAPIPTAESHTIAAWTELPDAEPFTHFATITASAAIDEDTQVELINNNAVLFAKHGFAIAAVDGQAVTVYSVDEPVGPVTLRIEIGG